MTDAAKVTQAIASTAPGSSAADLLDRVGETLGVSGRELFEDAKAYKLAKPVATAIRRRRFRYSDEGHLQQGIAAALIEDGFTVVREHRLDARSRIDLLVNDSIGVEVKVDGSAPQVQRQVDRYLALNILAGLVLVTTRSKHMAVRGRGVVVVCLNGSGL